MSSREHLLKIAIEAAEAANKGWDPRVDSLTQHTAEAVLNAILPKITHPEQLLDIPQYSWLITADGAEFFRLVNGKLQQGGHSSFAWEPATGIDQWGPLIVVWMP